MVKAARHAAPARRGARFPLRTLLLAAAVAAVVWLNLQQPYGGGRGREGCAGRAAARKAARGGKGGVFKEVFATLFAIEMRLLLHLNNDGPLPPADAPHSLDEIIDIVQVGAG